MIFCGRQRMRIVAQLCFRDFLPLPGESSSSSMPNAVDAVDLSKVESE